MNARSRVVLVREGQVALMRRARDGQDYYVFPGGGIEAGETAEAAAAREVWEELGACVRACVRVDRLLAVVTVRGVPTYFFLARLVAGEIGMGGGPEYTLAYAHRGTFTPLWVLSPRCPISTCGPRRLAVRSPPDFSRRTGHR